MENHVSHHIAFPIVSKNRGVFYGLLSALFFALLNVLIKISNGEFPPAETMFMRGFCGLIFLTPFVYKEILKLFSKESPLLWVRFLCGAVAVFCLFHNIQLNGAGFAVAQSNISALFVVFFSIIFLKERLFIEEWFSIAIVLVGVLLLHYPFISATNMGIANSFGAVIGIIGALSGGIAMTVLKKIAMQFSSLLIVWGFSLMCGILSFVLPPIKWTCSDFSSFIILLLIGLLGVYGQIFLTKSYVYLPSVIATVISLSTLLWSVLFESIYFNTMPNFSSLSSYGLIFIGLNLLQFFQFRRTKSQ